MLFGITPHQYDLAHIHWASYGILGLAGRIPYVVQCRGTDVRERLNSPAFRLVLSPVLRRAAAVLCITPDLMSVVRCVRPDALFLPAPVDVSQFSPHQGGLPPHPWTILLFTRLEPIKGVEVAIEGIVRFVVRHPEVRVQVINRGVLSADYHRRYGDRFEFLSWVAPEEVPELLLQADAVVGQFALGSLGLAELQAMSCARPVIGSFRYPSAYPRAPPLYQAAIAEEIDARISTIFQHPEEAQSDGRAGPRLGVDYHDYRALAKRLEALYNQCLGLPEAARA